MNFSGSPTPTLGTRSVQMKICVVTSSPAAAEPRAPRHARAAHMAFPEAEVTFVDVVPASQFPAPDPPILQFGAVSRRSLEFPTRASAPTRLATRKLVARLGRAAFAATGAFHESVFGDRVQGLGRILKGIPADLYIAHNIETLWPTMVAAKSHRAAVAFDCMEYYSDMGDDQTEIEARAAHRLEARFLPACALVIASSDGLADTLSAEYGLTRPLPAYNVPPKTFDLPQRKGHGLNLYWRNNVVGFGQRGLEDALAALTLLPSDVRLFIQGRLPADGGASLRSRIAALELRNRVTILPPYAPTEAVKQAAPYDIGLCLERRGPRNHDLTVSNKMFDYHMAGLAVIASDLQSLAQVVQRSGAGLVYEAGVPASLAAAIAQMRSSPARLSEFQAKARRFALEEANLELELEKIAGALGAAMRSSSRAGIQ